MGTPFMESAASVFQHRPAIHDPFNIAARPIEEAPGHINGNDDSNVDQTMENDAANARDEATGQVCYQ